MIEVSVTAADIAAGVAGDCHRCAVALALARATGDAEANVYDCHWQIWLEAHGRHVQAPPAAAAFVNAFDALRRLPNGRVDPGVSGAPGPLAFPLPDLDDPAWRERCCHCENLFVSAELDEAGACAACRPCHH